MNLKDNWKYKIIAAILALLLWFYVLLTENYQTSITVPISFTELTNGKTIVNPVPQTVKCIFEGRGTSLVLFKYFRSPILELELSENTDSTFFSLNQHLSTIKFPGIAGKINPVSVVFPDTFTVFLGKMVTKKIPVLNKINLELALNVAMVGLPQVIPDSVVIHGSEKACAKIHSVNTEEITLPKIYEDFSYTAKLQTDNFKNVFWETTEVKIRSQIQEIIAKKFVEVPIKITSLPKNKKLEFAPSTFTVTLEGGFDYLESINPDSIYVAFDFKNDFQKNQKNYQPNLKIPLWITDFRIKPDTFQVVLKDK
ncbi:hypothetical protein IT568_08455 [bacterium]|nr:hypothetical protein [bacterium]